MTLSWLLYLIISLLVLQNVSGDFEYRFTGSNLRKASKNFLAHCSSNGICLHSGACPWSRIIIEDTKCIELHNNFVCCEVDQVVSPLDLFWDYIDAGKEKLTMKRHYGRT